MKKAELYRSIEGIKPDKSMKNRIMTAAEENDKIIVRKNPVFLPVAAAVLLVINLGLIGNLMMGGDFNSRFKVGENSVYGNGNHEFSDYADKVYEEISGNDYISVDFLQDDNYIPIGDKPWFEMYEAEALRDGTYETASENAENVFVRYIQTIDGVYTNHEYIIGYDGNGYEKENILSITESNVDYSSEIPEEYQNEISGDADLSQAAEKLISEYFMENYAFYEPSYSNQYDLKILLFPSLKLNRSDSGGIIYRFPAVFATSTPVETDAGIIEQNVYFFIDGQGNDRNLSDYDNYWKDTVYADDADYATAELPDIENMNEDIAVRFLENMGYTNIVVRYVSDERLYNTVISYDYGLMPGDVKRKNAEIGIVVSGKQMPDIIGMEMGEAGAILSDLQIEYGIVYMYGADGGDDGLTVAGASVGVNEFVNGSEPVQIFVESDSSCLAAGLWSEMDLEYSYSENGLDYFLSDQLPDVILEGYYTDNGKVHVDGISTKSSYYEMCPDIYVGMTIADIDNVLQTLYYYQEKQAYLVYDIENEEDRIYGDYQFSYIDDDGMKYTAFLSVDGEQVSEIYVTKQSSETEESE